MTVHIVDCELEFEPRSLIVPSSLYGMGFAAKERVAGSVDFFAKR